MLLLVIRVWASFMRIFSQTGPVFSVISARLCKGNIVKDVVSLKLCFNDQLARIGLEKFKYNLRYMLTRTRLDLQPHAPLHQLGLRPHSSKPVFHGIASLPRLTCNLSLTPPFYTIAHSNKNKKFDHKRAGV